MKLIDELTIKSFRNPFLFSVIGSYFLNNFPLVVGFAFNVSSNPIGESEVLIQELNISYPWFIILFFAQILGKPTIILLLSLIKTKYSTVEKEMLEWRLFFTFREKYNKLKSEHKKNIEVISSNDRKVTDILNMFIKYLNKKNRNLSHKLIKCKKEIPLLQFIYIDIGTKEIETSLDEITANSYCLGFCIEKIGDYYIVVTESDEVLSIINNQIENFLIDKNESLNYYFTFEKGKIKQCNENDPYRCLSSEVINEDRENSINIHNTIIKDFYFNGVFNYDMAIDLRFPLGKYLEINKQKHLNKLK